MTIKSTLLYKAMRIGNFYFNSVLCLMFIFPMGSVIAEFQTLGHASFILLIGKWFVFWAIGVRLFTAGAKHALNPAFTLEKIFCIQNKESQVIVRELGFANICMGSLGILSLFFPQFRFSAAIGGGLYFGLAGMLHVFKKHLTPNELIALVSDIFIFLITVIYVILLIL